MGEDTTTAAVADRLYTVYLLAPGTPPPHRSTRVYPIPWTPPRAHPLSDHATEAEIEDALIGVTSTSPGPDFADVAIVKALWAPQSENGPPGPLAIILPPLFNLCLQLAYYPKAWKHAEVVEIPKPGKPLSARASPKGWRPIALLSVIGKGLERLVARRIEAAGRSCSTFGP